MKKSGLLTAVFLATAALPSLAAAQVPGVGLTLIPKAGLYQSAGDLVDGLTTQDAFAYGAALELKVMLIPFAIRANVERTQATDIENAAGDRVGTVTMTNITGDLLLRPLPSIIPVQPYLLGGGGVKQYKFRDFATGSFGSTDDHSDPTLHVGAGVGVGIGPLGINIEAGDYISRFKFAGETKLQNDLYGTLGIRIGIL